MRFTSQLLIASTFIAAAQANDPAPPLADVLRQSLESLKSARL